MRDDNERLRDVLEAIHKIERYASEGRTRYEQDELVQTWVVHHLLIVGEAVAGLSEPFRQTHADIPWRKIVGMRNILIHQYFGVDVDAVWSVIESDLPALRAIAERLIP